MANSHTVNVDGVGPVLFEGSKRAKHVSISVKPFTGVRVAVPEGLSFKKAEEFVRVKKDWILRHLNKMKQYEKANNTISDASVDIDRVKAKIQLTGRLKHLARKHGLMYNRVFIRNQKTRWGSCSQQNNIRLNMKLVKLPQEMIDYVILHELVHTLVKNHGNNFWAELDRLVGNGKSLSSILRKHGLGLL